MANTKISLNLNLDLKTLKNCYRNFYGKSKRTSVTKWDVAKFLQALIEADLQNLEYEPKN
jgi:hypothetical protein